VMPGVTCSEPAGFRSTLLFFRFVVIVGTSHYTCAARLSLLSGAFMNCEAIVLPLLLRLRSRDSARF
jgi:hypothetical protein